MKRYGNLWEQVIEFENLLLSARKAQRGKRFRENVLHFNYNLEPELIQIQHELQTQTYQPGVYKTFRIQEPKPRLISAAPYRDRVVHHALCNVIMPIFDRTFIADSYANRLGFGTHRALKQCTQFACASQYVLQCDIQKYFPSIDHEILKGLLRLDPLPRLKPVGFRTQAEIAGKACLTSPTPTDKTLPVFAIKNRDDRNRIFTSRESIVQSYHAGRAKNDSVAEAATHRTPSTSHG